MNLFPKRNFFIAKMQELPFFITLAQSTCNEAFVYTKDSFFQFGEIKIGVMVVVSASFSFLKKAPFVFLSFGEFVFKYLLTC